MIIAIDLRPLLSNKLSGVELYLDQLLQHLFDLKNEHTFILFVNAFGKLPLTIPFSHGPKIFTVRTKIPNKLFNLSLFLFGLPKLDRLIYKKCGLRPEVMLFPDLRPAALTKKVRMVSVVHDLTFEHYPRFFSLKSRVWYWLLNPKKIIIHSDHILAVSFSTKKDLMETYNLPDKKISVVHEAVAEKFGLDISKMEQEKVIGKYHLPKRFMLFLSTVEPRKNVERLLQAFQLYKSQHRDDLILVIAGQVYPDIFKKISMAPMKDVMWIGFVDEQDKAALISMAQLFLYPSLWEGFGLPLLEAMKVGTPIITSNISSMPEVAGDAAIMVDHYNVGAIADAMFSIQKPEIRGKLLEAMKLQVQKFSWRKCAEETLQACLEK